MRRAVPQDLDDIMWLEHASFPTDAWSASQMAGELWSPHGYYVVVETTEDGAPTVVGYAGLSSLAGNPVADVQTIAVAAEQRGRGIGRALFTELLDEARRRGVHEVFLEVVPTTPSRRRCTRRPASSRSPSAPATTSRTVSTRG